MPIPTLTHQQYSIISLVEDVELSGAEIRDRLVGQGILRADPTFYQIMGGIESRCLVSGRYELEVVGTHMTRRRLYRATDAGRMALDAARAFYGSNRP